MNTKATSVQGQKQEASTTQAPVTGVVVKQVELIHYIGIKNQITQLTEQKEIIETELKNLLIAGAQVEPGVHLAKAELSGRKNVAWREEFENLGDKLKGKGEGAKLAEKILENTEPTSYVKLTVK